MAAATSLAWRCPVRTSCESVVMTIVSASTPKWRRRTSWVPLPPRPVVPTALRRSAVAVLGALTAWLRNMPGADSGRVAAWKTSRYGPLALGIAAAHGLARLPVIAGRWIIDFNRRPVRASDEPKPRLLSWARVKYTWKNFLDNALQQPGSAKTIARGVALGVLIGMTPTVGIQWLVILLISKPRRASMAAAMSVIWISNPLTMAPIYWLDYVVGRFFRPGAPATEGAVAFLREASSEGIWEGLSALWTVGLPVFTTALAGGLILGAALAVPLYFLVLRAAKAYRGANRQANP